MPSQLLRSLLNRDENEVKDRMKSYLREGAIVGGVGYAAFKTIKGSNVINEVNNAVTSLNRDPEFNRVGRNLRQATEALGDLKKAAKTKALTAFSDGMNINEVFNSDTSKVGEKRAFYASLFDVAKDDVLTDDMRAIIKQGYQSKIPLTPEQQNRVKSIFESIKSNEKTLENFKRKYSVFSNARDLLDDNAGDAFERTSNQVSMESFDSLDDTRLTPSRGEMGLELIKIRERFNAIQRRAGKGAKVELVGFKEDSSKEVRSLYARISFGGDKNLNVPLFLAKDRNGNIIYRATENLSTRYVAPLRVLNAQELFNSVDGTSVKGGNLSTSKASYSFEEYVFQRITKSFGNHNGSLANISNREIMEFYEFQRSFGLDAPRGMFDQFSKIQNASGKNFVSHAFAESMAFARSAQSSRFLIAGLESFDGKIQQDIAKRLIQFFPDQVRGAGYPNISRLQDPFDRGQELSFTDIQSSGGRNAFNALSRYGRIDEIIQEQTAREFQMFGRYEMASGVKGLDNDFRFGAKKSITLFGSGESGELIGVDKIGGKGVHGVNLASIMISGDKAKALGLGEGMSYFGGQLKVNSSITNTVYDTGIGRTKLLNELIKVSKDARRNFLTIGVGGDYTIEEFFKNFANKDGEVIIGFKDQEAAKIVRRKGMESFTLGISEMSTEGGRSRYHITGEAVQVLDRSKMFSTILKDTTLGIDSAGIEKKLDEIAGVGRGASLLNQLFKNLNVDIKQTLLSTSDQLKKSPQYLSSQIAGSLELFGIGKDSYTKKMETLIGDDAKYLSYINKNTGITYTTLGEIGEKTRKAAYVRASIESALDVIKGTAVGGFTQEEVIGRVLGASKEYAERFGLGPKYGTEDFDTFFTRTASALGINSIKALEEINKGITFTAHYVSSGGIHTDYGRNLAKVEPRFMNYLYTSLRGNFGLDEEASTKFIGSFLARQEGIEGRSKAILGMKLTSLGLTKMGKGKLDSQIGTMAGVNTLDLEDTLKLLDFGSDEEATKEFLSKNKGSIFDFKNIIKDDTRLNMIKESLGGRSEIFLPGEETFEAIRGYTVAKSGENVNIEGEFSRYITDLTQSISGMQQATSDEDFANHFYGFKVAKSSIAKVAGLAIRNSLTGRITGSGTYMGQGIIFGKDPAGSRAGGTEIKSNHLKGLYKALEAKKGYVMFQDAQGFLDSMSTFRQAMIDQLRFDRFQDGDETAIAQEARRVTGERIKDFFFGMYKGEKSGVKITAQRNPNIYFAHFMPGMELMRYDFEEGVDDPVMKLFYMGKGKLKDGVFKAALDEEILKRRNRLLTDQRRNAFANTDEMKKHFARKIEIQKLIGVPEYELGTDGKIKEETIKTKGKVNPFTGEIEYEDKTVRKMTGLSFLDEAEGEITRTRTTPSSATETYAALLQKKMAEKRALIEQKLQAQSTIIKREAVIKGAYVPDSSDPRKIKTETIKKYTTAQKIDDEITTLRTRLASASEQEKPRIEAEIRRKEVNKSALMADTSGKTYFEREVRVRNNQALSEARAKLEEANESIARAKVKAANLKAAQKDMRSTIIRKRNIVQNALGYMTTTLEGRKGILNEAKRYHGPFYDAIKKLLKVRDFDPDLDETSSGKLFSNVILAKDSNDPDDLGLSKVYTNQFFEEIMGIRKRSIKHAERFLKKMEIDYSGLQKYFRDGKDPSSLLIEDIFDDSKIDFFEEKAKKKFEKVYGKTGMGKKGIAFEDALKRYNEDYFNTYRVRHGDYYGLELFHYFDTEDISKELPKKDDELEKFPGYKKYLKSLNAYEELLGTKAARGRISFLRKQKERIEFNLSRLAGLTELFDFDDNPRQTAMNTRTLTDKVGIASYKRFNVFKPLTVQAQEKISITSKMLSDYFSSIMRSHIDSSISKDFQYNRTSNTLNNLFNIIDDLMSSSPTRNKNDAINIIKQMTDTSDQGGYVPAKAFLNETFRLLDEEVETANVGNQTTDSRMKRGEQIIRLLDEENYSGAKGVLGELKEIYGPRFSTGDITRAVKGTSDEFLRNLSAFYGFTEISNLPEIYYDEENFFRNQSRLKAARKAFYDSGSRFNQMEMLLSQFDPNDNILGELFAGEKRTYTVYKGGQAKEVTSFILKGELDLFEKRQVVYTEKVKAEADKKAALEEIRRIEAEQRKALDTDTDYQNAKQTLSNAEARIAQIDVELASDPERNKYDELRAELNTLNERTRGIDFSTARLSDDEINALRTSLFVDPNNIDSAPGLISQLETLNSGTRITTMEEFYNAYTAHSSKTVTIGEVDTTVEEATNEVFFKALGRHMKKGDVGGGIVYFPQFDVKMDLVNESDRAVGKFESRLDFSRFAIGDFDADIYQIYHDTTNLMRQRFQNNAESFHGLFNAGTEFLIHMKELSKGMDEYGKRLTGGSLTMSEFKLDQYEKERILKSVGGLDVQIKVGMLSLAHSMAEESDPDQMSAYFKRIRTGASLIAVAQESLIIKAKHLNVAADVGSEFLGAMKKSYSTGEGKYLYDFFEQNIFKGSIYEHVGMEEEIKLQNIEFTNLPNDSKTAQSLKTSLGEVSLSKKAIKDTMDIMARTVKSRGYHALGSDTQLYKKLERGDAFNMNQLMRLLSVSMEGGFTGDISEDALDEIMNAQKTMRENIAMNLGNFTKRGGGYLAAAAIGAGYLAGVKTSPEVLNSETKFSDMRAKESIGGRHLYNMTTKEHGNVSPSRFDEPLNMYNRPINMGETMVTRNSSMRMYGEAPTQADAMMAARRVVGAGGNAFLGIQDGRLPISNSYITKSIKD